MEHDMAGTAADRAPNKKNPADQTLTKPAIAKILPNDENSEGFLLTVSAAPAKCGH